jgi:hypothetical protein
MMTVKYESGRVLGIATVIYLNQSNYLNKSRAGLHNSAVGRDQYVKRINSF